jgi:elongation factor G
MAADRHGPSNGAAPQARQPDEVRNVVLVGHTGAGKTTLVEALLEATGTISRTGRVEDGSTTTDFEEAEVKQQRSVSLALAPVVAGGIKINLLDTPGYADYVGELRAGLRGADCALFVVSATDGIDGSTQALWEECAAVGMPRAVVITKLDHARADLEGTLAACQDVFGEKVLPAYLPISDETQVSGLIALLSERVFDHTGASVSERAPNETERARIEASRPDLLEAIIEESEDETLMDRYLSGEPVSLDILVEDLEKAVAHASFFPVIPVCSATGVGLNELLEVITSSFPSPFEHPMPEATRLNGSIVENLTVDPDGPLVAEVIKTTSDPYVGRISLVRVFSGTLRPDTVVHVSGHLGSLLGVDNGHPDHDEDERVGALSSPLGKALRTVSECVAGDICAVAKLSRAETGDTLSDKDQPLVLRPWDLPEPLLPVAIVAHAKADEDKLSGALARLVAEDPTLRVENNSETRQLVLWTMGEAHADVVLDKLSGRYGVAVDTVPLRVPLRETFSAAASARGRHVKQSGGHGQFGICDIEIEPLPEGSGIEFVDKVVGGSVPRQFIPSVEKGVRAQAEKGVAAGYPMVDFRVTLVDGKAHSVDSSDMAFQTAGALALKEAADVAGVSLLEPVDEVSVLIRDDYLGAVMGDLSSRRGRLQGTEPVGSGRTMVKALVPQVEIVRYAIDLRSLSHGTGTFSRHFSHYEPMPPHLVSKAIEQAKASD